VARLAGALDEAERHYRAGLAVAGAARDAEGYIVACQGLGNLCVDQGLWAEARAWYTRGLDLLSPALPERLRWQLFNNLAVVAMRSGDLAESEQWIDRAQEAVREDDGPGRFAVQNSLGRLFMAQRRAGEAEAVYRAALDAGPGPFTRSSLLVNLSEALLAQGRLAEAEGAAREAELAAIRQGSTIPLLDAYRALGQVARARRDPEGFLFFEQALELCRTGRLPDVEMAATQHAYGLARLGDGEVEEGLARLAEALEVYERLGSAPEIEQIRAELARAQDIATNDYPN
jgi:tetratricopeptide (TPR) repeat protein